MKLTGSNFQGWDRFEIEVDGLTAIVGPSNLGKSAIHRAFKAITRNDLPAGWIKTGTSNTSITLTDGTTFELSRSTKNAPKYLVGGDKEYKKLDGAVPDEIKALGYGQVELGEFKFDPIFASQFDAQFGLSWTPGQINQVLGAFASTDKLEQGKKEANKRIQEANSEAKLIAGELSELEAQLIKCKVLAKQAEAKSQTLTTQERQAIKCQLISEGVVHALEAHAELIQVLEVQRILPAHEPGVGNLPFTVEVLEDLLGLRSSLTGLDSAIQGLNPPHLDVPGVELIELLEIVLEPRSDLRRLPAIPDPPRVMAQTIELIEQVIETRSELVELAKDLKEQEDLLRAISLETKQLQEDVDKIQCPKCGHEFEVE
jgi:hypothetical protein